MRTFYRWIVHNAHVFVILALLIPALAALAALGVGGDPLLAAAYSFMALLAAGALFGIAGLVVCMFALLWVILSLAFSLAF